MYIYGHAVGAEYADVAFQQLRFSVWLKVCPIFEKLCQAVWDRDELSGGL